MQVKVVQTGKIDLIGECEIVHFKFCIVYYSCTWWFYWLLCSVNNHGGVVGGVAVSQLWNLGIGVIPTWFSNVCLGFLPLSKNMLGLGKINYPLVLMCVFPPTPSFPGTDCRSTAIWMRVLWSDETINAVYVGKRLRLLNWTITSHVWSMELAASWPLQIERIIRNTEAKPQVVRWKVKTQVWLGLPARQQSWPESIENVQTLKSEFQQFCQEEWATNYIKIN